MLKGTFFILCFISFLFAQSQATSPVQALTAIPEELKKNANAVYRLDEGHLTVISPSEYILQVHQVVTLLNAEAAQHLHHRLGIDKFNKVEEVEISVLDSKGGLTKKYGKKDFETVAAFDGISLVTDNKVMKLYTPAPGYPCTVEVHYKLYATGYIELPNWYTNFHRTATELFRYKVTVPAALDIRHRTRNIAITPQEAVVGTAKQYTWEAKNIAAKELESEGFELAQYLPQIEVAPNEFSYDGFKGSFRSWKDFGKWNFDLYQEATPFTEQQAAAIKAMVASAGTQEEKIRILYRHMQQNMRYVSIQLGIGGFKPFAVKFVDEKKYGDCKALTNYMRYMLQTVGISSYPALINAGYNKVPADATFPTDPFNHVILCIPGQKDTTWLECTSTTNNAGELGTFTENKKALLLTENGGLLVNTPASDYRRNSIVTKNSVTIQPDGGASIQNHLQSSGEAADFYQYVSQLKDDEQKEQMVKVLHYKNPEELSVAATDKEAQATLLVNRSYAKLFDFKSGQKYFFPLCINPLATENVKPFRRETSFLFSHPYIKTDTTVFNLQNGFKMEILPTGKEIQTDYSFYKRTVSFDKETNKLTIVSTLGLKQHVIPADAYAKLVSFFKEAAALEEENFVLVKEPVASF